MFSGRPVSLWLAVSIVREYVFYVFFVNPKNATFYVFLKRNFIKRKKRNSKFKVSDFADVSLHGIAIAQKQCMFIIHMALVVAQRTTNLIGCDI